MTFTFKSAVIDGRVRALLQQGMKYLVSYTSHTAVVRNTVTYAATLWWLKVEFKTGRAELYKLPPWVLI
jgi:hypothetical protein